MCGFFTTPIHDMDVTAYVTIFFKRARNTMVHPAVTFVIAGFLKLVFATRDVSEVERPHLLIEVNHKPLHGNKIDVDYGQNVSLECAVHPIHHTVQWQINNRRLKPSNHIATLDFSNAHSRELGIYKCRSPSANLQRTLHVAKRRHWYHEGDDPSNYEHRSISVETFNNWFHDFAIPPNESPPVIDGLNPHSEKERQVNNWFHDSAIPPNVPPVIDGLSPHSEKERQDLEEIDPNGRAQRIHNIGVAIGGVAVGALILGLICVLCRDGRNSKQTLVLGDQEQFPEQRLANEEILPDSLCPNSTGTVSTVALPSAPECPLPPSYDEAIRSTAPSAPKL